jgi:hypothetical protein
MAARKDTTHSALVRKRIQTSQLVTRLETNALSSDEIMTAGQIRSAEILLKKAVPDLTAVDVEPDKDGELVKYSWDK